MAVFEKYKLIAISERGCGGCCFTDEFNGSCNKPINIHNCLGDLNARNINYIYKKGSLKKILNNL